MTTCARAQDDESVEDEDVEFVEHFGLFEFFVFVCTSALGALTIFSIVVSNE